MPVPSTPPAPSRARDASSPVDASAADATVGFVLDALPDAVLAVDADWRVTVANARALAVLTRSRAAVVGVELWALLPSGRESDVGRCCVHAATSGQSGAIETTLPGMRGRWRVHAAPAPGGHLVLHLREVTASVDAASGDAAPGGAVAAADAVLDHATGERAALAVALRGALEHGEFTLAYQPVVDLRTGAPTSVEALLRWHHSELGVVSPATFIPLAEELDLIGPIGAWVLRAACHAIAGLGLDEPLTVAVNVSGHQLQDGGFADEVAAVLAGAGLAPARLTLEVTETALVRDPRRARRVLGELRALGVRVAIDDFGTGYSSLGYLQQLPLDVLKIDKRFVDGVARGSGPSAAIPRAIIALGDALGLRTVGEGVETLAQRDALRALGCGYGQGYLFARPLALPDLVHWLDAAAWAGAALR